MSPPAKPHASRHKATLCTGPRSPEGKAVASRNALKHGLLAANAILPEEDTQAFLELLAGFHSHFRPADSHEEILVKQLADAEWRLARLIRLETGLLETRLEQSRPTLELQPNHPDSQNAQAHPAAFANQGTHPDSHAADYFQITRHLGLASHRDCCGADAFTKLCRYENSIRRAFYKSLHALQSAQARRLGQPPPRMPK